VLDQSGAPIVVNPNLPVEIGADGSVSQGGAVLYQLGIVEPQDYGTLR
jgi:hypothetical protein